MSEREEVLDFAADRASFLGLSEILTLKADHEQKMAAALDRMTAEFLREVFKLGYRAGATSEAQ